MYSGQALSERFVSNNFSVQIVVNCPEGHTTCEDVTFKVVLAGLEKYKTYKGSTFHTMCADRVASCKFLGYKYKTIDAQYFIYKSGLLLILDQEGNQLLAEIGKWS